MHFLEEETYYEEIDEPLAFREQVEQLKDALKTALFDSWEKSKESEKTFNAALQKSSKDPTNPAAYNADGLTEEQRLQLLKKTRTGQNWAKRIISETTYKIANSSYKLKAAIALLMFVGSKLGFSLATEIACYCTIGFVAHSAWKIYQWTWLKNRLLLYWGRLQGAISTVKSCLLYTSPSPRD